MKKSSHSFRLTLIGLALQGMGLLAHAACGTQSGTDYTFDTTSAVTCVPPANTTSITVNSGITLTSGSSNQSIFNFDYANHLTSFSNAGVVNTTTSNSSVFLGYPHLGGGGPSAGNSIDTFTNQSTGQINSPSDYGIMVDSFGTITHFVNYGVISALNTAISNGGTITQLDNYGTLKSTGSAAYSYGIFNYGTLTTLNNGQGVGNANGPLTYTYTLPINYNIIITSTTNYGQLAVSSGTGTTTFGISSLSTRGSSVVGAYSSVITGLTNTQLGISGSSYTGTSNGYDYTLAQGASATSWDLTILTAPAPLPSGPTAADTQESLKQSASALRPVFNQQSALINNSLNYDCTVFAANGVCVSAGGRFATTNSITGEQMSTLLVASYKTTKNTRIGGFIDQNGSSSSFDGASLDKSPMYGVFGVWNENPDLMGYEVRIATNWADQNITQTRNVVGTSEAGTGSASLKSQAYSVVVSYAMPVTDSTWIASPYAGIRKTKITRSAYTESSAVTTPLTYSDLSQDVTTALAGVRMNKKYNDDLYVTASVGVEQSIGSNISTLDAIGVTGLTPTDFSANYAKTRPVASAGVSYAVAKDQRINFSVHYRKEAFQSAGSTTGLLMYQVGF